MTKKRFSKSIVWSAVLIYGSILMLWLHLINPFSWFAWIIGVLTLWFVLYISISARFYFTNIIILSETSLRFKPATKQKLIADFSTLLTMCLYLYPGLLADMNLGPDWFLGGVWIAFFYVFIFVYLTIRNILNSFDYIQIQGNIITYRNNFKRSTINLSEKKSFFRQLEERQSTIGIPKMYTIRNKNRLVFLPKSSGEPIELNLWKFNLSHEDMDTLTQTISKNCELLESGDYKVSDF